MAKSGSDRQRKLVAKKRSDGLRRMEHWIADVRGTELEAKFNKELDKLKERLDELTKANMEAMKEIEK